MSNGPLRAYTFGGPPAVTLTVFCAAHLQSTADIDSLLATAASCAQQSHPTRLWLSVSHEAHVDRQRVLDLGPRLPVGGRVIAPRSHKAQFEHFRLLVDKYVDAEPICLTSAADSHWVCFINLYDTFAQRRVDRFVELIMTARVGAVDSLSRLNTEPVSRDVVSIEAPVETSMQGGMPIPIAFPYYQYAVTVRSLHYFLIHTPPLVLQHRYADEVFCGYAMVDNTRFPRAPHNPSAAYKRGQRPARPRMTEKQFATRSIILYAAHFRNPNSSPYQQAWAQSPPSEEERRDMLRIEAEVHFENSALLSAIYASPRVTDYSNTLPPPQMP